MDYVAAWTVYLICVLIMSASLWYWTRNMQAVTLRKMIRLSFVCILLLPHYSNPEQTLLAPALVICLFDLMQQGVAGFSTAGTPILVALSIVMGLSIVSSIFNTHESS